MSAHVKDLRPGATEAAQPSLAAQRRRQRSARALVWAMLLGGAVLMLAPFLWLVSTSLKTQQQVFLYPPQWIPNPVRWQNYPDALSQVPFGQFSLNTLLITLVTMAGVLLTSSMAAYGFARLRFPGRDFFFVLLLSALMLPYAVTMIPQYIMFKYLGWIDTYLPLTVPPWFGGGIFNIFLLRQFFRTIPSDLVEAARIDGAGEIRIYAQVMLPLAGASLAVVAIFTFINTWNDFMGPLIYISTHDKYTIALGLAMFKGLYSTQWQYLMAASTVMITPIIVLFFLAQRYFVQGIVMTGTKG